MASNLYPHLEIVSKKTGLSSEKLLEVFSLEHDFYIKMKDERSYEARQKLYEHVYTAIGEILISDPDYFQKLIGVKTKIAFQFRKELENRSVLDVGCGNGSFLYSLARTEIKTKELYGFDIKAPEFPDDEYGRSIHCYQRNIIKFEIPRQFDTLMLDNVYEHIDPKDKGYFLESLSKCIAMGGRVIMIIPNRLFGPTDFTRIIDDTMSGKVEAQCVHLNETTFTEIIRDLKTIGLTNFKTTIPFIAFSGLRNWFPGLRLPASWFVAIENSPFLLRLLRSVQFKGRCLFRMEVVIIAER